LILDREEIINMNAPHYLLNWDSSSQAPTLQQPSSTGVSSIHPVIFPANAGCSLYFSYNRCDPLSNIYATTYSVAYNSHLNTWSDVAGACAASLQFIFNDPDFFTSSNQRNTAERVLILISDFDANVSMWGQLDRAAAKTYLQQEVNACKQGDIKIYPIGIGPNLNDPSSHPYQCMKIIEDAMGFEGVRISPYDSPSTIKDKLIDAFENLPSSSPFVLVE